MTAKEIRETNEAYGNDNMKFIVDTVLDFLANTNGMDAYFTYDANDNKLRVSVTQSKSE